MLDVTDQIGRALRTIEGMALMDEKRFTAANIADVLADTFEVQDEDKGNLRHRVRYLAKKHYLRGGKAIDKRGTLDFPTSEVFHAAILCEFLSLSMDIKIASSALKQAEKDFRLSPGNYPDSARRHGGWAFSGYLETVLRGIEADEDWWLVVELRRSGTIDAAGLLGRFTHANEQRADVDATFGRAPAATVLKVNLTKLFGKILENL